MRTPTVVLNEDPTQPAMLVAPVSATLTLRLPITLDALDGLILTAEATRREMLGGAA